MEKRSGLVIMMGILEQLRREPRGPTRIAQAANVAFDKCVPYLDTLERKGLISKSDRDGRDVYSVTQAGIDTFLDWQRFYEGWNLK